MLGLLKRTPSRPLARLAACLAARLPSTGRQAGGQARRPAFLNVPCFLTFSLDLNHYSLQANYDSSVLMSAAGAAADNQIRSRYLTAAPEDQSSEEFLRSHIVHKISFLRESRGKWKPSHVNMSIS